MGCHCLLPPFTLDFNKKLQNVIARITNKRTVKECITKFIKRGNEIIISNPKEGNKRGKIKPFMYLIMTSNVKTLIPLEDCH